MALGLAIRRLEERDLLAYKALRDEMLEAHPEAFTSDAGTEAKRPPSSYRARFGLDRPPGGGQFVLGAWLDERLVDWARYREELRLGPSPSEARAPVPSPRGFFPELWG